MRLLLPRIVALCAAAVVSTTRAQLATDNTNDTVRVTVAQNQDGSRTTYQYDNPNHKAVATTKSEDGKLMSKILYNLDDMGRFAAGEIYDGKGQLRFKTQYKYDANGRLGQETQFNTDGKVRSNIVYSYNEAGKQSGYTVFDADGNQTGHNSAPGAAALLPPKPKK
ncbi:MAG: hypothetical protein M3128_02995 [Verrucomicrobiota bacterium]|nr:hypothetical protein [Verrucomicrobiota bacterium]